MTREEIVNNICNELKNGRGCEMNYTIEDIQCRVRFIAPSGNIHSSSILLIPLTEKVNNQIIVEANNLETNILGNLIDQAERTATRLVSETSMCPAPILIPLLPSYREGPYYQQLSAECFSVPEEDPDYRIDEQVVEMISNAKNILSSEFGLEPEDKIFLNGYSSSGVFAQRFALLHPEVVETACIGGASGSIPLPTDKLDYPLGIGNYEQITGKKFDLESYSKIRFRYYVGELETINKASDRTDDEGNLAPMHDMSYFDRSVPHEVGMAQREMLGKDLFKRAEKTVEILKSLGFDIEHTVIKGRAHNNKPNALGVNELGEQFIESIYEELLEEKLKNGKSI